MDVTRRLLQVMDFIGTAMLDILGDTDFGLTNEWHYHQLVLLQIGRIGCGGSTCA